MGWNHGLVSMNAVHERMNKFKKKLKVMQAMRDVENLNMIINLFNPFLPILN